MRTVRAKFFVTKITNHYTGNGPSGEVVLVPVYSTEANKGANAEWSKWTPQGECKMTITNPAALEAFGLGDEFFVDFTPAKMEGSGD